MTSFEYDNTETEDNSKNDDKDKAFAYIARVLGMKSYSEYELRKKLSEHKFTAEAAEYAISKLTEMNLIDDMQYAINFVAGCRIKGYGKIRIKQELLRRGIDRQIAEDVLSSDADENTTDEDFIKNFLAKRFAGSETDQKTVSKAVSALMRRGFTWEQISAAMHKYTEEL